MSQNGLDLGALQKVFKSNRSNRSNDKRYLWRFPGWQFSLGTSLLLDFTLIRHPRLIVCFKNTKCLRCCRNINKQTLAATGDQIRHRKISSQLCALELVYTTQFPALVACKQECIIRRSSFYRSINDDSWLPNAIRPTIMMTSLTRPPLKLACTSLCSDNLSADLPCFFCCQRQLYQPKRNLYRNSQQ